MFRLEVHVVASEGSPDRTVPIARTVDPRVVRLAAETVVREAEHQAAALERQDVVLGRISRSEAHKLASILEAATDAAS
jgi:hypothetical protein